MIHQFNSDALENSSDAALDSSDKLQVKESEETSGEPANECFLEKITVPEEIAKEPITALPLSVRLENVLNALNINFFGEIDGMSYVDFQATRNCGAKTVSELREILESARKGQLEFHYPKKINVPQEITDLPVKALPLSVRLTNVLESLNIKVFGELNEMPFSDFQAIQNCGAKTVSELRELLERVRSGEFSDYVERFKTKKLVDKVIKQTPEKNPENTDFEPNAHFYLDNQLYVPQQLKEIPIAHFPLSVRLMNVLMRMEIQVLGDLQKLDFNELAKAQNCGNKTLAELNKFIAQIQNSGDAATDGAMLVQKADQGSSSGEFLDPYLRELTLSEMLVFINKFIDEIPTTKKEVMLLRYGATVDERTFTLEEIAGQQNLTRERIRQIQANCLKTLSARLQFIGKQALNQIYADCINAACPLTPQFLVFLTDNEFSVFQYPPSFYIRILADLKPNLPVFVESQPKSPTQLSSAARIIVRKIEYYLNERNGFVTLKEVFENVISYDEHSEKTINAFFEAIRATTFVIENGDSPNSLLISINRSKLTMLELARQILARSDRPLTPEEIIERGKEIYGDEIEMPSPNSLANLPGYDQEFYLLDRRTIGLRQHFRLPFEFWDEVRNDFFGLLSENGRTYSTTEVIASKLFPWTELTNPCEVAEILREDERFKDLGRFNFAISEWQIEEREPIKDLIVKVLEQVNHPLTGMEIAERIQQFRSAALTTLPAILRQHEKIRAWSFGFYGLKEWQDDFADYFVNNQRAIKNIIKQGQSLTFAKLCEEFRISPNDDLADKLWETLSTIPRLRKNSVVKTPEAIIKRN
jgi:DNA-directed RNA polymerase alpha subunit